jgi:hypothetical protein
MTSLSVSPALANSPAKAVFVGKANIQDITNPLNVISIAGNQTLQVSMTDRGEPGFGDDISIIVYRDANVYFSSNWNGTNTNLQVLDGGNIKVHSIANFATGSTNSVTTLTSSAPTGAIAGQQIVFTATVTGGGAIKPTGTVLFVDVTKNAVLGTGTINTTTGVVSLTTGSLSVGMHEIAVYYGGDSRYAPSGRSIHQLVNTAFVSRPNNVSKDDAKTPELFLKTAIGPNPSTTHFTLQVRSNSDEVIQVMVKDMLGRPVEILKLPADRTLDFGHRYYAGTYFVQVRQGKKTVVEKIIKL